MNEAAHFTSTKSYYNFPCAHRQWRHTGHCAYVHGYSRSFHFEFQCSELDLHGFVMDFGGLKAVKAFLEEWFDHTLLLNEDDPLIPEFQALQAKGACKLKLLPNVGMESSARFVYEQVNAMVQASTAERVWVSRVEVRENDKNSAIYTPTLRA